MDVKTLCLGILSRGEATGYEIKKLFETDYSHFYEASFGSIYPALAKLTDEGLVSFSQQAQDKRPDKKVYRITAAGRLAFLDELTTMPGRDRIRSEFLATLLFGELLAPAHVDRVIAARIAEYREALAAMEACDLDRITPGHAFVHGFGVAVYRAAAAYLEENRHLLVGETLLNGNGNGNGRPAAVASQPATAPAPMLARSENRS